MATLLTPIRSDNAYFGFGKQSSGGTAVAPSLFPRWHEGSTIEIDLKAEDVWEGDGSRRLANIIKNTQMVKIKYTGTPRPIEIGFLETAAMGIGSDTVSAATVNTTFSSSAAAGATSFQLASNTGLTGSGTAALVLSPGTNNEEVVTVTTPGTGAGPYTYTIANSGTLKNPHTNGDNVNNGTTHAISDQSDGNYYSIEVSIGGTSGIIIRARDCKMESIKRSAKAGGLVVYETEWVGIACLVQASAATVTLDTHQSYLYTQGVWTLDGVITGDALAVDSFDIQQKNNLDTGIQAEQLTLGAIIFGNLNVDLSMEIVYQNANRIATTYFGSVGGTTDAQGLGTGSLSLVFTQPDNFHTMTLNIPYLVYTKASIPQPKKDGKSYKVSISATATSNQGSQSFLIKNTLVNTQTAAY